MTSTLPPSVVASLLAGPARPPPPGVVSNFRDPANLHTEAYVLLAVAWTLMTLALAMRLFVRWYLARTYVVEDFLILVGWAFAIAYGALGLLYVKHGAGVHMWDQSLATFIQGTKYVNIVGLVYDPLVVFIKVAILLQFLRLFAPTRRVNAPMFFACWTWIIVTVVFYAIDIILKAVVCSPLESVWNPFVHGHCIAKTLNLFLAAAVFNMVSDILILVLPLLAIYKLNMKTRKKIWISSLFAAGALACTASTLRMYYSFRVAHHTDISWHTVPLGICAWFEISLGIVVFCLPAAPRFFLFVRGKILHLLPRRLQGTTDDSWPIIPEPLTWNTGAPRHPHWAAPDSLGAPYMKQYTWPPLSSNDHHANPVYIPSTSRKADSHHSVSTITT